MQHEVYHQRQLRRVERPSICLRPVKRVLVPAEPALQPTDPRLDLATTQLLSLPVVDKNVKVSPTGKSAIMEDILAVKSRPKSLPVPRLAVAAPVSISTKLVMDNKLPNDDLPIKPVTKSSRHNKITKHNLRIKPTFGSKLRKSGIVYGMALIVFGSGMAVILQTYFVNISSEEQAQVLSAASSNSVIPSEEEPTGDYVGTYRAAPSLPRLITIPSLGVKARVLQTGVDASGQLGAPNNIFDTAWYTASSKPGEMGAMVIDGHYSGPTTNGVFSKIEKLNRGDIIQIERGDGQLLTYEVRLVETKLVNEVDMSKLMISLDTATPGLNLITCGGSYNSQTYQYNQRTVIYALQK